MLDNNTARSRVVGGGVMVGDFAVNRHENADRTASKNRHKTHAIFCYNFSTFAEAIVCGL